LGSWVTESLHVLCSFGIDASPVTWKEINDATTGGKNFGWPTKKGNFKKTNDGTTVKK
jgi:hypothetical protein